MSVTMYQASIPVFQKMLGNLSGILSKAAEYAETRGIAPSALLGTRLFPDMFPLLRQVQLASDFAKGAGARLAGIDSPVFSDTETTFAELQERLTKTQDFLASLTPDQINGSENRSISFKIHDMEFNFTGISFLTGFATPNFYFHLTTAYAILRASGLDVGKKDFIGSI